MAVSAIYRRRVQTDNTATAYVANDVFGTPRTNFQFTPNSPRDAYIDTVTVYAQHASAAPVLDIYVFRGALTTTTLTDNAAFALDEAEARSKLAARIRVADTEFVAVPGTDLYIASKSIPPIKVRAGQNHTIAFAIGANWTPPAVDNIDVFFGVVELK